MTKDEFKKKIGLSWFNQLESEFEQPYFQKLLDFVETKRKSSTVFPSEEDLFKAFQLTSFENVKVVIVGQDPYHGKGQAHGLCFSVPNGIPLPPSLKNIYKELVSDINIPFPKHGSLSAWAKEGVLLLNATLTVEEKKPMSHSGKGWEIFTDAVLKVLSDREDPIIFVLWGNHAEKKFHRVLNLSKQVKKQYILRAAHPSPLSVYRGFFGCKHFSKINELLKKIGKSEIDWSSILA